MHEICVHVYICTYKCIDHTLIHIVTYRYSFPHIWRMLDMKHSSFSFTHHSFLMILRTIIFCTTGRASCRNIKSATVCESREALFAVTTWPVTENKHPSNARGLPLKSKRLRPILFLENKTSSKKSVREGVTFFGLCFSVSVCLCFSYATKTLSLILPNSNDQGKPRPGPIECRVTRKPWGLFCFVYYNRQTASTVITAGA